jgi:hypothetical protein
MPCLRGKGQGSKSKEGTMRKLLIALNNRFCIWLLIARVRYFFNRFSLCFLLFSSLSFLVIGFFLVAPVLNAITTF